MNRGLSQLNHWLVAAASFSTVVVAGWFAYSAYQATGASIHRLTTLGNALSETSRLARDAARAPQEQQALLVRNTELQARIQECAKPSLVVAEISENTRAVGASVLEIKPIDLPASAGPATSSVGPIFPRYHVSIVGNYRQVAEFMRHCARQRLPVRVAEFNMTRVNAPKGAQPVLRADIVVESYQAPRPAVEGGPQAS